MREALLRDCDILQLGPQASLHQALEARNRLLSLWMPLTRSQESWQQRRATQRVHEIESAYQHLYDFVARGHGVASDHPVFDGATSAGLRRLSIYDQQLLADGALVGELAEDLSTSVMPLPGVPAAAALSPPEPGADAPMPQNVIRLRPPPRSGMWVTGLAGGSAGLAALGWSLAALAGMGLGVVLTLTFGRAALPPASLSDALAALAPPPALQVHEVQRQVWAAQPSLARCLDQVPAATLGSERMDLVLTLAATGAVRDVALEGAPPAAAPVRDCLAHALRQALQFPAQPVEGLRVRMPLHLVPLQMRAGDAE